MKYQTKTSAIGTTLYLASIHDISGKSDIQNCLVGQNKNGLRQMIKKQIADILKKNHRVMWNQDTKYEVNMFKVKEYDELNETHSEFITKYTVTTVGCIGKKKDDKPQRIKSTKSIICRQPRV